MNYTACESKCEAVPTVDNVKSDNITSLVRELNDLCVKLGM